MLMPSRPNIPKSPRRWRSKTISAQGVKGQQGINLIERVVLLMRSHWTPSGPNEIGIDGYIELFDPNSQLPLGLSLAVQSKVVSAIGSDSSPTFNYTCDSADLEYWLSGNMPVILVVSSPASDEAYWVSVKDTFKDWTPNRPKTTTFVKDQQAFTADSFSELVNIAAPKPGLHLASTRKKEQLHSNLLRIDTFPDRIFVADTECRRPRDVWALLRKNGRDAAAGWVLRNKRLVSFQDLSDEPWTTICDIGTVEGFPVSDWSDSLDPDRQRDFVQLLNQTLRAQLSPEVRYWSNEECFAILGEPRKLSYQSLKRRSSLSVVSRFSKTAQDGRIFEHRRHMAFRGQFRPFDTHWYLEITPTYRFTRDGLELDRYHEDRLKRIKQIEGNRAVLSCVLFWADYLRPKKDLLNTDAPLIRFGTLLSLESAVGINDQRWLSDDPGFDKVAGRQHEPLLFSDIEDLFHP